jgi:hypothetical protein
VNSSYISCAPQKSPPVWPARRLSAARCPLTMARALALVLLSFGLASGQNQFLDHTFTSLHVFTKVAPPMSNWTEAGQISGYSIQMIKDYLAPKLGLTDMSTTMLFSNNEIMSDSGLLSSTCDDETVLCIGAAAISITESREVDFDFLTSYYTNNVRILTTITPDPADILILILLSVWQLVVGILLFFLFFILFMAPLVWSFEMLTVPSTTLPIFMPSDKDVDKHGGKHAWPRSRYIVSASFRSALTWTYATFMGTQLSRPQSSIGQSVLLPLTKISASVVGIIATAACAAIFTIDLAQAASIGGVEDLGPKHTVCYNALSSFNTGLVTGKASEQRFQTLACYGLAQTLSAYYREDCDAVIYDEVILQGDLIARRKGAEMHTLPMRVQKSGVVGDSLKWDPYGFLMRSGHPHYEAVNRAVVSVATDSTVRETLQAAHLRLEESDKRGLDLGVFAQWLWYPAAGGLGLIVLAVAAVYVNLVCNAYTKTRKSIASRTSIAAIGHSKFVRSKMRKAKLERGMADIALQPADELMHEMAFDMQDLQSTMQEVLEILGGKQSFDDSPRDAPGASKPAGASKASDGPGATSASSAPGPADTQSV